ncbi:hypothetical protein QW71_11810 [Paenibacillus sp. IHB B 3415]|nr:hypothetical protein QW71_11810 [Paenibacillus sp. IHB B 3415]
MVNGGAAGTAANGVRQNVVLGTTRIPSFLPFWTDCCMKYKNSFFYLAGTGGMLHFLQQFKFRADVLEEMLYFGQEY